jgi:DNA-binding PadR family transcriptional regulator
MLGELEQLLLLAVLKAGTDAYGLTVLEEVERATGRSPTLATVHTTLARLESKGFVTSWLGESTPRRGGRAKRHFAVTPAGKKAVRESLAGITRLARGLSVGWEGS